MLVILQLNLITTAICIQVNSNCLGDNSITTIKVSGYVVYKVSGALLSVYIGTSRLTKSNVLYILSKIEYYKSPNHRNLIILKYCTI